MKAAGVIIAVALALTLQTTLGQALVAGTAAVDLVLVSVVYVALTSGPTAGMLAGSAAGLIQDSLSSGVIGIGGLAKCIVGFLAGSISQQFIVTTTLPRLVMFIGATALHAAVFMGLYVILGLRSFPSPWQAVAGQAVGNSLVGMLAFTMVEGLPIVLERRRVPQTAETLVGRGRQAAGSSGEAAAARSGGSC